MINFATSIGKIRFITFEQKPSMLPGSVQQKMTLATQRFHSVHNTKYGDLRIYSYDSKMCSTIYQIENHLQLCNLINLNNTGVILLNLDMLLHWPKFHHVEWERWGVNPVTHVIEVISRVIKCIE